MKTSLHILLAALAATVALAGCVQEITSPSFEKDKVNPAAEGSRVIAVSFASQTKTILDGFQPKFANKDSILISNGEALDTCEVKVDGKGATITTNLTGPLTAVYPYKAAKMNESNLNQIDTVLVSTVQSGKFADANICMAKMTDEKDESLSFENKTALFKIIPGAGESTQYVEVSAKNFDIANDGSAGSTRTIHVATTTADSVYVSILVPEGLTVGSLSFSDGTNVKTIKDERASTAIAAGTLYTVTNANWESTEADIPDGALKGVFSVSADKQVQFSQGNLRYVVGTDDWGFYEHQYDFCNATTFEGHHSDTISLFTCGYDAEKSVIPDGTGYVEGHTTDGETFDKTEDWGFVFEGESSIWRTLTRDEWCYLFAYNPEENNFITTSPRYPLFKTGVTVCGSENCVVIAPDGWNLTEKPLQLSYGTEPSENNPMTWEQAEAAGLVALPAAGCRGGSAVYDVGGSGSYWSSTADDRFSAYYVLFYVSGVGPGSRANRHNGNSVRLVTDVPAAPTPAEPAYVEITAKYDGEDKPERTLKWYRQNLAITDSGNKPWKGDNTSGAVKVPGTNEDVIVGDYFQWGAYAGYCGDETAADNGLLIYSSFNNTKCVGVTGSDGFTFKSAGESKTYRFNTSDDGNNIGISPYYSNSAYSEYTSGSVNLESSDDVASIILGDTWRMPTSAEFKAMKNVTYWAWDGTDQGYYVFKPGQGTQGAAGERGVINTTNDTKADALLFFPAAGCGDGASLYDAGSDGGYRSSSLYTDYPSLAYRLGFDSDVVYPQYYDNRYYGFSVRPVSE